MTHFKTLYSLLSPGLLVSCLLVSGLLLTTGPQSIAQTSIATESTYPDSTDSAPAAIVVTLKPLYSLVAQLTRGVQQPTLLIEQTVSSHHYNLRPSQRQALADADIIIWFGPQMEPYLNKIIQQQVAEKEAVTVITAMQSAGLTLLNKRYGQAHQKTPYGHGTAKSDTQNIDPHIWLSTKNATAICNHISDGLIAHDPKNTALYKANLREVSSRIEQTRIDIDNTLKKVNAQVPPFLSYHDAFQYFARENHLKNIDAISYHEETGPGIKHLRDIRKLIAEKDIHCLVYQPPKPALVDSLITQTGIRATALDPLGINIGQDEDALNNAWFEIMHQLANGFKQCLSN